MSEVEQKEPMDFDEWLAIGIDSKWCLYPTCYMHDGIPTSDAEEQEMEEGGDPCMHVIRLFTSEEREEYDQAYARMHGTLRHRMPYTS